MAQDGQNQRWHGSHIPQTEWLIARRFCLTPTEELQANKLYQLIRQVMDNVQVAEHAESHVALVKWIQAIERGEPPHPWQPL